ncbi:MAG: dTDP-4-dehydrorhamnose reductase [Marinifilaceae bacterium]
MATILVTGKNGQLGRELQELVPDFPNHRFIFTGREELDICSSTQIKEFTDNTSIDYIINCAAYTKVDHAEEEHQAAQKLNQHAVGYLGKIAKEKRIRLIHISTDYVFSGKNHQPYSEEDSPCPISQYGKSKWEGEKALTQSGCEHLIIRTSWLYSPFRNNFVKTMLQLGQQKPELNVVFDQIGTPTYAKDLALAILTIVTNCELNKQDFVCGIYNYSNEGVCSWYDFATEIQEVMQTRCKIHPIESKNYPTIAPRPHYSVLNKSKIKHIFELDIPYWKASLIKCLKRLKEN